MTNTIRLTGGSPTPLRQIKGPQLTADSVENENYWLQLLSLQTPGPHGGGPQVRMRPGHYDRPARPLMLPDMVLSSQEHL